MNKAGETKQVLPVHWLLLHCNEERNFRVKRVTNIVRAHGDVVTELPLPRTNIFFSGFSFALLVI